MHSSIKFIKFIEPIQLQMNDNISRLLTSFNE